MNDYLYGKLPEIYRKYDDSQTLKKFLNVLEEEGLNYLYDEVKGLITLVDADKCPSKYLPFLFETYGMPYDYNIPEVFQRKFLKNISYLYSRKGTKSVLRYLGRELSGYNVDIIDDYNAGTGNFVLLIRAFVEQSEVKLLVAIDVIERYLKFFIPITSNVRLTVSYGFSDEIIFNFTEEDDILKIKEQTELTNTLVYSTANMEGKLFSEDIAIVEDPEQDEVCNQLKGDVTSVITFGVLSHNMYTNKPCGMETIYSSGTKTIYIY